MATCAAAPGRPNEDFTGVVPNAAVLLDGAGIPDTESICRHGVAWYTHRLGGALLGQLSRDDDQDLTAILGDAIERVTDEHRHSCDVTNPSSPQATVAIFRVTGDRADYLVLADAFVVLNRPEDAPLVLTDPREVTVRHRCAAALSNVVEGTPEYDAARGVCIDALRARRNQTGGYWIAKDDPRAASEAVTGSRPIRDVVSAAVLSNGACRIVDRFGSADWQEVLATLDADGPSEVIRRVREAEAEPRRSETAFDGPVHDDATIAYCTRLSPVAI